MTAMAKDAWPDHPYYIRLRTAWGDTLEWVSVPPDKAKAVADLLGPQDHLEFASARHVVAAIAGTISKPDPGGVA